MDLTAVAHGFNAFSGLEFAGGVVIGMGIGWLARGLVLFAEPDLVWLIKERGYERARSRGPGDPLDGAERRNGTSPT